MPLKVATPVKMTPAVPDCVCGIPHKMTDGEGPGSFRAALRASSSPRRGTDRRGGATQRQQLSQQPPSLDRSVRSRSTSGETAPSPAPSSGRGGSAFSGTGAKSLAGQRVSSAGNVRASPARRRSPAPASAPMSLGGGSSRGSTPTRALLTPSSDTDSGGMRVALGPGARRKTPSGDSVKSRSLDSGSFERARLGGSSEGLSRSGRKKNASGSSGSSRSSSRREVQFDQYLTLSEVQQGLKKGELLEGVLRINPKNFEDAYISAPDGQTDIYIGGVRERNRALHGDVVVVKLKTNMQWKVLHENVRLYLDRFGTEEDKRLLMTDAKVHTKAEESKNVAAAIPEETKEEVEKEDAEEDKVDAEEDKADAEEDKVDTEEDKVDGEVKEANKDVFEIGIWTEEQRKEVKEEDEEEEEVAEEEGAGKKNRRRRRGKRRPGRNKKRMQTVEEGETEELTAQIDSALTFRPPDSIVLIGMDGLTESLKREWKSREAAESNGKKEEKEKIVVAPHELSEAESVDDDDDGSVDSITVDLDQVSEDREFSRANIRGWGKKAPPKDQPTGWPVVPDVPVQNDAKLNAHKVDHPERGGNNNNHTNPLNRKKRDKKKKPAEKNGPREGAIEFSLVQVLQHPQWLRFVQRTATVVYLKDRCHPMCGAGHLRPMADGSPRWALFSPRDHRVPRMRIPSEELPDHFAENPNDYAEMLFVAKVAKWNETGFAIGQLVRCLGNENEVEVLTQAILAENDVDESPFKEEVLQCLPPVPYTISAEELARRRDFRDECVFTIDPLTARDLDDAVSCRPLPDGTFEVGVHIADVSYFIKEGTALDQVAASRATSVYVVQKMIPMLPATLCTDLCSLHAGEDKMTMSVVWKLTSKGEIKDEWFGRSVIRSCTKMAYEHAQLMIDDPNKEWSPSEHPPIHGPYTPASLSVIVNTLNGMAEHLRRGRFKDGALRLDQPKLSFALDGQTGLPVGFCTYEHTASHRLIEEFMLLANQSVARKIVSTFPQIAFLRCHPPPHESLLVEASEMLSCLGIHIDVSSSGALQRSLEKYGSDPGNPFAQGMKLVLVHICSKAMQCAKYFCSGSVENRDQYAHYALSVPLYTHFTSPIRRYADVMVHRLLAASLGLEPRPAWIKGKVKQTADHCNKKKLASKVVQDLSSDLFLAQYVRSCEPVDEVAMIMDVKDYSCDVLISRLGAIRRLYVNCIPASYEFDSDGGTESLKLTWRPSEDDPIERRQVLNIFAVVHVRLTAHKDPTKFNVELLRPKPVTVPPNSEVSVT